MNTVPAPQKPSTKEPSANDMPHLETSNIRFSRILVATDFSKAADEAVKTAVSIATIFHSQIYLVHAADITVFAGPGSGPLPPTVLEANLAAARARLDRLVFDDPRLRKLKPRMVVAYAEPTELIEEVVEDKKIDLVLVGSHGPKGVERLLLGSVAEAALGRSTCPVLIVGPQCRAEENPFCSILFATDLTPTGLRAAQYASALAEQAHGKLTYLHVIDERSTWPVPSESGSEDSVEHRLAELLPAEARQHCRPRIRVESGDPAETIAKVAREECAGLLVIDLKERRPLLADHATWSTLSRVIGSVHCPVLGVREHVH
jgi:nucleotide-binding universal stress UspA family protein